MPWTRRQFVKRSAQAAAITTVAMQLETRLSAEEQATGGNVNHSVCKWCYKGVSLEDLCVAGKEFGLQSIELLNPEQVKVVQKHGLTCAIMTSPNAETKDGTKVGGIPKAFNRVEHHDALVPVYEESIKTAKNLGIKNIICFSGNRDGLDDEQGMKNCAIGLKRIMPMAEKHGITISMELLNSKVNHKDYMCDHTQWGVELCKAVGSDNFKMLYDIYHMQIMEGDIIANIKEYNSFFSHYHTGGVPGRNEIDETQELNYPAIARAIVETGYKGFIGQEFIPKRDDKIASLRQGVEICDV
jgi:hydroxypyruvate isomerase